MDKSADINLSFDDIEVSGLFDEKKATVAKEKTDLFVNHDILYVSAKRFFNPKKDLVDIITSYLKFIATLDPTLSHKITFRRVVGVEGKITVDEKHLATLTHFIDNTDLLRAEAQALPFIEKNSLISMIAIVKGRCLKMINDTYDFTSDKDKLTPSPANIFKVLDKNMSKKQLEYYPNVKIQLEVSKVTKQIAGYSLDKNYILNMTREEADVIKNQAKNFKEKEIELLRKKKAKSNSKTKSNEE